MTRREKRKQKYGSRPDVDGGSHKPGAPLDQESLRNEPHPGSANEEGGAIDERAAGPKQEPAVYDEEMYPFNEGKGDEWTDSEGNSYDGYPSENQPEPAKKKAPGRIAKKLRALQ